MAEEGRMTAAQAVDKLMASEHADVIRESVRFMVDALMEAEVSAQIGAEYGERAPDRRLTQRNGYRERTWDTRAGAIELAIPRLRSGPGYFPGFLEPRRRAEQALVAVVQEAYVNGVSTRKVDRVVEQLGVRMSKDQVSDLCRRLDEHVTAFRERPLEGAYPYLWLDAKHEKVREGAHVVSKALVIAYAVHETGRREVIGLDVGQIESEAFWREFLRSLKRRGLDGVRLCVSDSHEGLKKAIARVLGCPWQRCTVHFVRDMHQHCRPSQRSLVSAALREVFKPTTTSRRASTSRTSSSSSHRPSRRLPNCSPTPSPTCSPSTPSRPSTGPSCAARTRSSASTARSAAAPTSSASSPTTAR
jgi:putative transposase